MPLNIVSGLLAMIAVMLLLLGVRFLIGYVRTDDAGEALDMTSKWTITVLTATFGVVSTGLVEFGDLVGQAASYVGMHPYAISNIGVTILGALGISGTVEFTTGQFTGVAIAIIGLVLIFGEVEERVS